MSFLYDLQFSWRDLCSKCHCSALNFSLNFFPESLWFSILSLHVYLYSLVVIQ